MNMSHFIRRLHLYMGLALLPWVLMYGLSSGVIAHNDFFNRLDNARGLPLWTSRGTIPFDEPVPADPEGQRELGRRIVRMLGIERPALGTYRLGRNFVVVSHSFLDRVQVKYAIDRKELSVEDRRLRWEHVLADLHVRGGFRQDGLLAKSWGIVVDVVCAAFLLWIATGIYMWWRISGHRSWGWVALASGVATFLYFTFTL